MNEASDALESLLLRARRRVVLQRLLDALPVGLSTSALVALVSVGVNHTLISLDPAFAGFAMLLPTAIVLLRETCRRAPTLEEVAGLMDRWFDSDEILTTAWDLQRRSVLHTANTRRVMRLAEKAMFESDQRLRSRRIRLSGVATASLAILVASALPLGLEYEAAQPEAAIPAPFVAARATTDEAPSLAQLVGRADRGGRSGPAGDSTRGTPQADGDLANAQRSTTTELTHAAVGSKTAGTGEAHSAAALSLTAVLPDAEAAPSPVTIRTTRWVDIPRTGRARMRASEVAAQTSTANAPNIFESSTGAVGTAAGVATRVTPSFALEAYLGRYLLDAPLEDPRDD